MINGSKCRVENLWVQLTASNICRSIPQKMTGHPIFFEIHNMLRSCANIRGSNLLAYKDIWQTKWKMSPVLNQNVPNGFFEGWKPNDWYTSTNIWNRNKTSLTLRFARPTCWTLMSPWSSIPYALSLLSGAMGIFTQMGEKLMEHNQFVTASLKIWFYAWSQNFMQMGPKIDDIGARACITYTTVYCFSRNSDISRRTQRL